MRWHLASKNDGRFIINTPPRPSTDDECHDDHGPTVVLNVVLLTDKQAQEIVDAHNEAADEIERLREAIRNVLEGRWSMTGLQEILGDI